MHHNPSPPSTPTINAGRVHLQHLPSRSTSKQSFSMLPASFPAALARTASPRAPGPNASRQSSSVAKVDAGKLDDGRAAIPPPAPPPDASPDTDEAGSSASIASMCPICCACERQHQHPQSNHVSSAWMVQKDRRIGTERSALRLLVGECKGAGVLTVFTFALAKNTRCRCASPASADCGGEGGVSAPPLPAPSAPGGGVVLCHSVSCLTRVTTEWRPYLD